MPELCLTPDAGMFDKLEAAIDRLLADDDLLRARLRREYERHLATARRNPELLAAFAAEHGWRPRVWAA